jgi:hypothetical protein
VPRRRTPRNLDGTEAGHIVAAEAERRGRDVDHPRRGVGRLASVAAAVASTLHLRRRPGEEADGRVHFLVELRVTRFVDEEEFISLFGRRVVFDLARPLYSRLEVFPRRPRQQPHARADGAVER